MNNNPIRVAVSKEAPDDKVGVIFKQEGSEEAILVHSIAPTSLFANTRLQVGMEVLSINGTAMDGYNFGQAMRLLREAQDVITIEAQLPTAFDKHKHKHHHHHNYHHNYDEVPGPEPVEQQPSAYYDANEDTANLAEPVQANQRDRRRSVDPDTDLPTEYEDSFEAELSPPKMVIVNDNTSTASPRSAEPEEGYDTKFKHNLEPTLIGLPEERKQTKGRRPDPDAPSASDYRPGSTTSSTTTGVIQNTSSSKEHKMSVTKEESHRSVKSNRDPTMMISPKTAAGAYPYNAAKEEEEWDDEEDEDECEEDKVAAKNPVEPEDEDEDEDWEETIVSTEPSIVLSRYESGPNIRVTACKAHAQSPVGIGLRQVDGVGCIIEYIRPEGIFANTALRRGMKILDINGHDCRTSSKYQVVGFLKAAQQEVTIVASSLDHNGPPSSQPKMVVPGKPMTAKVTAVRPVAPPSAMPNPPQGFSNGPIVRIVVAKQDSNQKVGLSVADQMRHGRNRPIIVNVSQDGLCAPYARQLQGMALLCVNNVECQRRDDAIAMLRNAPPMQEMSLVAGPAHIMSVTMGKSTPHSPIGINLVGNRGGGGLVIDSIDRPGLWSHTLLEAGMKVHVVNDVVTDQLEALEAMALLQSAEDLVTIVAEPPAQEMAPASKPMARGGDPGAQPGMPVPWEQPNQTTMGVNNNPKAQWTNEPDCCAVCIYTVWDSAADYNRIAAHVGGVSKTECGTIYCARIFGLCGGICLVQGMAEDIKSRYEAKHNLEHQDIDWFVACCGPEATFKQIIRDYENRTGQVMQPAADSMVRE